VTVHCEVCDGTLDHDRLRIGPLKKICLECLTADQRDALEHDLDVASQYQAQLLPARNLSFGRWQIHYHYEPLGVVSGDHIDLIRPPRSGQALHFLFGDVSGKGIAASLLMANLQALFRSLVSQDLALGEIVQRANRLFSESTAANSFATLVAGRLNGGGRLELVNAGHNPPLLVRADSTTPLAAAAPPLGITARSRYTTETHRLAPEDFLFLYTDGLSEARNFEEEEFGTGRLECCLDAYRGQEARDVVSAILDDVRIFQSGAPQVDDVTAMAIRLRG